MTRQIKFRAWLDGEMIYGEPNYVWDMSTADTPKMQFIGLLDKNGKEIYEGDILKWEVNSRGETLSQIEEVKFENGSFTLNCPKYDEVDIFYGQDLSEYSVIGNMYENPELLK